MALRFIFAVHNHQPVGNFDAVFEGAYRDSYLPFLKLLDQYPEIPFSLHTSGCLMEWLVAREPEYVERLRGLVARGQVEIMGGGFYEPILPMIPPRDRVGQIRTYTTYLENLFQTKIRGLWVPERVWEQNLVSDIAAAGIEYTVLDDHHFKQAGLEERQLHGYYLTEDGGRLLRIFAGSERMRYLVPFRNPEETVAYFAEVLSRDPDATIVFADDGEKFGSWPETHKHCYQDGWLRRFLDVLRSARSWVRLCTFTQALDETPPAGRVYLPDCSYREMTEWALPVPKLTAYRRLVRELEHDPRWAGIQPFLRGGYWRNFRAKYPEIQEMYSRMLQVSRRLQAASGGRESPDDSTDASTNQGADAPRSPGTLTTARRELYRAQCNCAWWHGAFGGLYLPHLRTAVYQHLIAAENALLDAERRDHGWVEHQVDDLNLDGAPEVRLSNSRLAAFFNLHSGGTLYELDVRGINHNLLATLSRRPEAYHEKIRHQEQNHQEKIVFKQAGLDQLIQYDFYLRKSLIDHFYEAQLTLEQVAGAQESEIGDFVTGRYEQRVRAAHQEVKLSLHRAGQAAGISVRVTKEVRLRGDSDVLEIRYLLDNLPKERKGSQPFHFAIEFNFAGMAAGADDRYFYYDGRQRAGQLQTLQDLTNAQGIGLVDEWLGLEASLSLSRPGGIWAFPIQTVSQSEGGFELVHQSTVVMPHWIVEPDGDGRWQVTLELRLDVSRAERRARTAAV